MTKKGFTLIELIIVIAIIAILAAAIFVAVDPARRLHETRNARRWSDISTILDAVKKYQADNEGTHFTDIANLTDGDYYRIGTESSSICDESCAGQTPSPSCVDLTGIGTNYLAVVPVDPKVGTQAITGYMLMKETSGAVTIYACEPEGEGPGGNDTPLEIQVTR
ncbi:prepilin-type N-terminal cleavage/methylation domain-containing protein [Candidatus Peregrinibacteria bacterium]|nr:prepilin-type N-terminal cleavage/methylation domain-containing protein [Candidatus Peregrinibacteria bacterium]